MKSNTAATHPLHSQWAVWRSQALPNEFIAMNNIYCQFTVPMHESRKALLMIGNVTK